MRPPKPRRRPDPLVYRMWAANDRLIYIGATQDVVGRFAWHEEETWWFRLVRAVTLEPYPTMEAAFAAEAVAIQEEQPAFNLQHTGRSQGVATDADIRFAVLWRDQMRGRSLPDWIYRGWGWSPAAWAVAS